MGKKRAISWPRRATYIYANTQIMTVWYDVDIISESTRWQCHGFLLTVSWNIRFLLKYLNVTRKCITPILKIWRICWDICFISKSQQIEMIFLRKGRSHCARTRSLALVRHLSCSWALSAGCLHRLVQYAEFRRDRILTRNQNIMPWKQAVLKTRFHFQL